MYSNNIIRKFGDDMKKIVVSVIALAFSTLAVANERNQIINAFDLKLGSEMQLKPISQRYSIYKKYEFEKISYNHYQFVTKNNIGPFKIIDIELDQNNKLYSMYSTFTTESLDTCSWEMSRAVTAIQNAYDHVKEFTLESRAGKAWGLVDDENRQISVSCKLDNNLDYRVTLEVLDNNLRETNSIIDLVPSLTKENEMKEGDLSQLKYKVQMKQQMHSSNKPSGKANQLPNDKANANNPNLNNNKPVAPVVPAQKPVVNTLPSANQNSNANTKVVNSPLTQQSKPQQTTTSSPKPANNQPLVPR